MPVRTLGLPTPLGPRAVDRFERFDVIGLGETVQLGFVGRPPGPPEYHSIEVPPGTEFIVPIIEGWRLAYFRPARDHNIGLALCNVVPEGWEVPPRTSEPPHVRLTWGAAVADGRAEDRFTATIRFSLLYLRRAEAAYVPAPPSISPLEIVLQRAEAFRGTGLSGSSRPFMETASSRIPAVASSVVPAMSGFLLGYGDYDGPMSPHLAQPAVAAAHGLHSASAGSVVARLGTPTGETRQLEIRAALLLRDAAADKPWYGALDVNLLAFAAREAVLSSGHPTVAIVGLLARGVVLAGVEGAAVASETFTVDVPAATTDAVPLLFHWSANHGELVQDRHTGSAIWDRKDRRFGVAQVGVQVLGLRPGPVATLRRAHIRVSARLHDGVAAADWEASVGFTLLCLQA